MRRPIVILGLCVLGLATVARAEDIAPGLWELALEAAVEADPAFQPGPMTVRQCVTRDDARDPGKILGPISSAGASDCSYAAKSYVGRVFRFTLQCSGTLQLRTTGEVTFSGAALRGVLTTSSAIEGKPVEFRSTLVGHRIGEC
ncbi:MAG TPA: DUF3617 family protein [Steroidobacteraceae bacterium]|nr:DUF3617 family protein [Steroidobacteraceae bacterium]